MNADLLPARSVGFERDLSVDFCEQRVVTAASDVLSSVILRSALANEDVTGLYDFTAKLFYAETLSARVASVSRRAACFFVSHTPI